MVDETYVKADRRRACTKMGAVDRVVFSKGIGDNVGCLLVAA